MTASYAYYIKADYEQGAKLPVNIESKLSATVYDLNNNPVAGIPVTVKPQWATPQTIYSDTNGKVSFSVKPISSGNFTITFSSEFFATLVTYVNALPAVLVEARYDPVQYMDPIAGEDIILYLRARDSEKYTTITSPKWSINIITRIYPKPTIQYKIDAFRDEYRLAISISPRSSEAIGTYTIEVEGSSTGLLPVKYSYNVVLRTPAIFLHYTFETGEKITLAPHQSGTSIEVTRGCKYFDINFTDSRGRPLIVTFIYGTDMLTIIGQAGGIYTIKAGDISYEWYTGNDKSEGQGNRLRVYFVLTETFYHIYPYVQAGIGGYLATCKTELIVATVKTGFDIWAFITNPYIFVGGLILAVVILSRLLGGKKE